MVENKSFRSGNRDFLTGSAFAVNLLIDEAANSNGSDEIMIDVEGVGAGGDLSLDISGWTFIDFGSTTSISGQFDSITLPGVAGDHSISGSSQNDTIDGGASGNDRLRGMGGDDTLPGRAGDDRMEGGGGNDLSRAAGRPGDRGSARPRGRWRRDGSGSTPPARPRMPAT